MIKGKSDHALLLDVTVKMTIQNAGGAEMFFLFLFERITGTEFGDKIKKIFFFL